jgi:Lipid A 3-O-deacylase (PagL)
MRKPMWLALMACLSQSAPCLAQDAPNRAPAQISDIAKTAGDSTPTDPAGQISAKTSPDSPSSGSSAKRVKLIVRKNQKPDFNRDIYYQNKLELAFQTGWLSVNIPLVWDFLVNSPYTRWPLSYTLVPNVLSLRWHLGGPAGPFILRGSWDATFSAGYTMIPRGPETRYLSFDSGIRRNFIQRNWHVVPYFEMRGGVGDINAKGPDGVIYAQGQDLTFTFMMGSGARYNFNPQYSLEAGVTYMHISNAYLSLPKYQDYGINVYGETIGFNMRLGKPRQVAASE